MENLELKVEKEVKEEEVKEILEQKGEVTNEKIENSLNYESKSNYKFLILIYLWSFLHSRLQ